MTEEDIQQIDTHLINTIDSLCCKYNLIFLLFESFESWAITEDIMPAMTNLSKEKVFFSKNITSQVLYGTSGDGQMICNTGMLPINKGAACMLYGQHTYPNFAGLFSNGYVINPCGQDTWNQQVVTLSYGYKEIVKTQQSNDFSVSTTLINILDTIHQPFCLQAITISTHAPFSIGKRNQLGISDDCPTMLRDYLNAMNYADSCFGIFLKKFEEDSALRANTVVVITGDHTIFQKQSLQSFQPYAQAHNLAIPAEKSFCPLIIYSPLINEHVEVTDTCYQMDVFPTILHAIGADDYWWKGFGVNLYDSIARHNRPITPERAYELSDKIIRSNYFAEMGK